ncbi:MAG: hypothetical protein JKY84_03750 [Emcibacteraceae bacterium]|nr:hypothetical protein [Emcibacteraceae bacterium]
MVENLLFRGKIIWIKSLFNFHRLIGDQLRGLNFENVAIEPEQLGYDGEIIYRAEPQGGYELYKLISKLNIQENDAIIDIGCGQGSAIRTMHKFPFKRIDGIEIAKEIAAIAIKNFQLLKNDRSNIFIKDAVKFTSYDNYNIFYIFNPFPPEIFAQVITKINDSIKDSNKEAIIIYINPTCHDTLVNNSNFRLMIETDVRWEPANIYTNYPPENSRLKTFNIKYYTSP